MNVPDSLTKTDPEKTVSERPHSIDPALPTPQDLPNADVLIFDGNCSFCTGQVLRISRWSGGRITFISLHDPQVKERFPDLTEEMLMKQMYLVTSQGHRYGGAGVLRYLSRRLPRLWVFAPLLHIPGTLWFWQWCYQRVAIRRYQISARHGHHCHDGSCEVHFKK